MYSKLQRAVETLTVVVAPHFKLDQLHSVKDEMQKWRRRHGFGSSFSDFYFLEVKNGCDGVSDEPLMMIGGDVQLADDLLGRLHRALIRYFQTDSTSDIDSISNTCPKDPNLQKFIEQANLTLLLALDKIERHEIERTMQKLPLSWRLTLNLASIVIGTTLEDCKETDQVIAKIRATFESKPNFDLTRRGNPTDSNNMASMGIASCLYDAFMNWRNALHNPVDHALSLSTEFHIGIYIFQRVEEELKLRAPTLTITSIAPNAWRDWGLIGIQSPDQPFAIFAVGFNGSVNWINSKKVDGTWIEINIDTFPNPFSYEDEFHVHNIADGNIPLALQSIADAILSET